MPGFDRNYCCREMFGEILDRYVPCMGAYDSRVNGNNHNASDLDRVIHNPRGLVWQRRDLTAVRAGSRRVLIIECFRLETERRYMVVSCTIP